VNEIESVNPPVQLITAWEVANRIGADSRTLEKWVKDPEMATPPSRFCTGSRDYWSVDDIPSWERFYEKFVIDDLNITVTKMELVDALLLFAKRVTDNAERAGKGYSRRSYPKGTAKELVNQAYGVRAFVSKIGQLGIQPKSKADEINKLLMQASRALGMD